MGLAGFQVPVKQISGPGEPDWGSEGSVQHENAVDGFPSRAVFHLPGTHPAL